MQIFHIAEATVWAEASRSGHYSTSTRGATLEQVGFIHASQADQVAGVLDVVYADVDHDLLLLVIDTDRLTAPWQLDDVPGAAKPFPHVYGPLNADAVVGTAPIRRSAKGWSLPEARAPPTCQNLMGLQPDEVLTTRSHRTRLIGLPELSQPGGVAE